MQLITGARFGVVAALLVTCSLDQALAQGSSGTFGRRHSDELLTMEGVWRSRGYGVWWVVLDGRVTTFEAAEGYCRKIRQYRQIPNHASDWMQVEKSRRTIRLSLGDRTYLHTFDKVVSLPTSCNRQPGNSPIAVFDAAVSIFSAHYAFFQERGIDWQAHASARRQRINPSMSETELFQELTGLIKPIDDGHVGLEGEVDGRTRQYEPPLRPRPLSAVSRQRRAQIGYWTRDIGPELVGHDIESTDDGRIKYGLIGNNVGYLYVASTGRRLTRALVDDLDDAKELFRGARALVIDVSKNFGGIDSAARSFASRFTRKRVLGYYKYAGDTAAAEPQAIFVEPSDKLIFDGPIYVVTSASTVSAAEILVMCLRALPNVTHIGAATRGSLSDILEKRLPNGWLLNLSNEVYLDHERKAWEGRGIRPHIEFPVESSFDDAVTAKKSARRMLDYILSLPSRRRSGID